MNDNIEYIKVFMEYESCDVPIVYFYEVDLNNERLTLRSIEIFADRHLIKDDDFYHDVIEITPIPTVDELNNKVWGEGFYALLISKDEFYKIWESGVYNGDLSVSQILRL